MAIGRNVITAGVVLIIGLIIYIMVVNTVSAQNTALWDAFGISFWTEIGPMLLVLVVAIGILIGLLKMFGGPSEGL